MSCELDTEKREALIAGQIEDLKESIFLNEVNVAKWQLIEGDWSNQIAQAEKAITDAKASIDALSAL